MPSARYSAPSPLDHLLARRRRHPARSGSPGASRPRSSRRLSGWLGSLPHRAHLIPYAAFLALAAGLLVPGVVPHGGGCGAELTPANAADRELFIHASAAAFGLIAGLLLLSAVAANVQRRGGWAGVPTLAGASVLGAVTLVAVIWPHAPMAAPVQMVMAFDLATLILSYGVVLALVVGVPAVAWRAMTGARAPRAAQIGAWVTLLVALPLMMAVTYLTVTPMCWG